MLLRQPVFDIPFFPRALGASALSDALMVSGCGGRGSSGAPAASSPAQEAGREVAEPEAPTDESPHNPPAEPEGRR